MKRLKTRRGFKSKRLLENCKDSMDLHVLVNKKICLVDKANK